MARDSIKAMEELIHYYKNHATFIRCPLCTIIEQTDADDCSDCPWQIFTGEDCDAGDNYFAEIAHSPKRRKKRIRQLYYWISVYKKALNTGGTK